MCYEAGLQVPDYDGGRLITDADMHQFIVNSRDKRTPLLKLARDQCIGAARREFYGCLKNIQMLTWCFACCHTSRANAQLTHAFTDDEWGRDNQGLVDSVRSQTFKRHHLIAKNMIWANK